MAAALFAISSTAGLAQPAETPFFIPGWHHSLTARAGGGYKDNITYAHLDPQASPFATLGADALLSWTSFENTRFSANVSADEVRYTGSDTVDHERFIFAQAQVKKNFLTRFEAAFSADYLYQDRVLDLSTTETNRLALPVRNHVLTARPGLKLDLPAHCWTALEWDLSRQIYAAPLDDYWQTGPHLTFTRTYGHGSELGLTYGVEERLYDTHTKLDEGGFELPGTHRRFLQHEVRLAWRHYWDPDKRWRTATRLGYRINEDQGPGFFDYTRASAGEQLVFKPSKPWELSVEARVYRYDYSVQTVSATDPSKLNRTDLLLGLRCERTLTTWLRVVGAYDHERALSNDRFERNTANTVTLSLEAEF